MEFQKSSSVLGKVGISTVDELPLIELVSYTYYEDPPKLSNPEEENVLLELSCVSLELLLPGV